MINLLEEKVLTIGTYDHLDENTIEDLKSAKDWGDTLIVAVLSDSYHMNNGTPCTNSDGARALKLRETGLVDEVVFFGKADIEDEKSLKGFFKKEEINFLVNTNETPDIKDDILKNIGQEVLIIDVYLDKVINRRTISEGTKKIIDNSKMLKKLRKLKEEALLAKQLFVRNNQDPEISDLKNSKEGGKKL